MKIPYMDLSVKSPEKKQMLLQAVDQVLSHGRIILGPEVGQLEEKIAAYCHTQYAVGVGSGTDALYLALRSLDIGPGDEVITTPLSWIATVNAIVLCGATPVFVDIGENMNINASLIEDVITEKTKAILPVHYTGRMCDMATITKIASTHNIYIVEDAAQAFGASINGAMAGSFGEVSAFSLNAMKVFNAFGEAGAVVTNNEVLANKLRSLSYAGTINKEDCHYPSLNGRLDTIQAAMLLVSMEYLEAKIARRREIARYYTDELEDVVKCPEEDDSFQVYYSYVIRTDRRDQLKAYLGSRGVETKVHYPVLMPFHTAYREQYSDCDLPVAKRVANEILSIPNHEDLSDGEAEYVAKCVREFFTD
jgi:dTDP-4-amino-4,6-dideoxygalactose transaminase